MPGENNDYRCRGASAVMFSTMGQDSQQHSPPEVSNSSSGKDLGASVGTHGTARSSSIPLPSSHVHRTQSELQLRLDQEAAELREMNMFHRLVNGTRDRHSHHSSPDDPSSNEYIQSMVHARATNNNNTSATAQQHNNNNNSFEGMGFPRLPVPVPPIIQVPPEISLTGGGDGAWSIGGFLPADDDEPGSQQQEEEADDDDGMLFSLDL